MLLRRITQHVQDQNWFAVLLDFFIVVVGILIAFQITEWNESKKIDRETIEFTHKLQSDLAEEAWMYEFVIEYYNDASDNAARVVDALEGKSELSDEALVIAAFRATQYVPIDRRRSTFDELTSTGRISLINDIELRTTAKGIYEFRLYENIEARGIGSQYREAFRKHTPSAVQRAVQIACGDRFIEFMNYDAIIDPLSYRCSPDVAAEEIKAAADVLRKNETILPLLRLRLAELESSTRALTVTFRDIHEGLKQYRGSK